MSLSNWIDPTRCYQLITGIIGIYISYLTLGVVQESVLKQPYINDSTGKSEKFTWPSGTLIFPCALTWVTGVIINRFTIPEAERVAIPNLKSAKCGLMVTISTLTYSYAILLTNYPVVQMFKSCNLISVLLVGLCCSTVRDKKLQLTTKKLVVGIIITIGIIIFKYFDPAVKQNQTKTQIAGIALLIISFIADGFLPDFQADIKSVEKPTPMQMLAEVNKWATICSLVYACVLLEFWDICLFLIQHWRFSLDLFIYGICGTVGQMFVYRMIKQFKQHFVPFVITTRKIFTVALSLIWYQHETNAGQVSGILLVFALVTYEFVSELVEEKRRENEAKPPAGSTDLSLREEEVSPKGARMEAHEDEGDVKQREEEEYAKRISGGTGQVVSSDAVGGELIEADNADEAS